MRLSLFIIPFLCACSNEASTDGSRGDASAPDASTNMVAGGGSAGSSAGGTGGGGTGVGGVGPGAGGTAGGSAGTPGASGASGAPSDADAAPPTDAGPSPSVGPTVDRSDPQLYDLVLDPVALDPAAVDYISDQYALLDTRSEALGKLVFFLPGANNTPSDWRNHGRKLAEFGFHVLIPHYNNAWGDACAGQGGSCSTDTRWEALTGEDTSTVVDISRADSAEGRVLVMLEHLATAHPEGDWGFFVNADGSLRDEQVVMAGISHGATSTGLFASRRPFWRAVMHSGAYGQVGDAPATPITAFFALSHTDDPQHAAHLSAFDAANLPGTNTSIDGASPPYGGARRLITSEPNAYPHCSVVVHSSSPVDASGSYIFEPAWRYMYGVQELTP